MSIADLAVAILFIANAKLVAVQLHCICRVAFRIMSDNEPVMKQTSRKSVSQSCSQSVRPSNWVTERLTSSTSGTVVCSMTLSGWFSVRGRL